MEKKKQFEFYDETLICCDCGQPFIWSAGEQRYYWSKNLSAPKRCPSCREKRHRTLIPDTTNWPTTEGAEDG